MQEHTNDRKFIRRVIVAVLAAIAFVALGSTSAAGAETASDPIPVPTGPWYR